MDVVYVIGIAIIGACMTTVVRRYEPNWLLSYSLVSVILLTAAFAISERLGW